MRGLFLFTTVVSTTVSNPLDIDGLLRLTQLTLKRVIINVITSLIVLIFLQMADVVIPYGKTDSDETVKFSMVAFPDQDIEICDDMRDDQNFKGGDWFKLKEKCPHFFSVIKYQYAQNPVPISANYNGYDESELCIRIVFAFLGRLMFELGRLDSFEKAFGIFGTSAVGKTKIMEFVTGFFPGKVFNLKPNPVRLRLRMERVLVLLK